MEVAVGTTSALKHANHHHTTNDTLKLFYRPDALLVTQPTVSNTIHINDEYHTHI